jgi:hypothetical protein
MHAFRALLDQEAEHEQPRLLSQSGERTHSRRRFHDSMIIESFDAGQGRFCKSGSEVGVAVWGDAPGPRCGRDWLRPAQRHQREDHAHAEERCYPKKLTNHNVPSAELSVAWVRRLCCRCCCSLSASRGFDECELDARRRGAWRLGPVRKRFGSAARKPLTGMSGASRGPTPRGYGSVWVRSGGAVRSAAGKRVPALGLGYAVAGSPPY